MEQKFDILSGIDISEHNGIINWQSVKNSGQVDFVMLRAGYGKAMVDKRFIQNATECERLRIPYGIYWFSYAKNVEDAKAEANRCLEVIAGRKITYPVAFDWEDDSLRNATSCGVSINGKQLPTLFAETFLDIVGKHYTPMLYTNTSYLNQYFESDLLDKYDFWIASWYNIFDKEKPAKYKTYKPAIWQYSSTGKVPGITGQVDMNFCYVQYDKKEEEDMTPEQVYDKLMEKLNFKKQSSWAEKEIEEAKEIGFTDGSNPYGIPSRAEVMVMIKRAFFSDVETGMEIPDFPEIVELKEQITRLCENLDRLCNILEKK